MSSVIVMPTEGVIGALTLADYAPQLSSPMP
jgi:hypothetical protein